MKKRIIMYCLLGAPIGVAIGTLITVLFSLLYGDGAYYPVPPALEAACGSEIRAVVVQLLGSMLYGAACGGSSVIWSIEEWSLLRQTVTHLVLFSAVTMPFAWLMHWMKHSIGGILGYLGIFFLIYLVIWFSGYMAMKKKLREINEKIQEIS